MNPRLLAALYIAAVFLPLALSAFGDRPPRSFWDELASGAGMLAYAIILTEFVLSGRFRSVSRRIGMDATMRFHQLFARTALALALLHPFLYQAPFDPPRPWDVTRELTLTLDLAALGTGVAAWLLLLPFVLLAIGRDRLACRYETWRLLHGLGALLIAGLLLHHTLEAGRYSADPLLARVWIGLFAVAVLTLVYVYLIDPLLMLRRPWKVGSVRRIADRTWELTLEPDGHDGLSYEAGQFVWLNVGHSAFSLHENPFSLSSAPGAGPGLQFVIKELGDFTRSLGAISPGTRAWIDGQHGNLTVAGRTEPGIALIAGGVGVAPLLGILRQLRLDGDARPVKLIFGNRIAAQIVYPDELAAWAAEPNIEIVHTLSEPPEGWTGHVGMVDATLLGETFTPEQARTWLFVLCGPPPMMEVVEDALIAMGTPSGNIMSERFKYD